MYWMTLPLKRYFDFSGRSRRMEFWMFQLFQALVMVPIMLITFSGFPWSNLQGPEPASDLGDISALFWVGMVLAMLAGLALLIPNLAVTIRRLHDRDMSGWWYGGLLIASIIPILNILAGLGFLVLFVIFLLPGTTGPNRFGPDPKDPSQASVFA